MTDNKHPLPFQPARGRAVRTTAGIALVAAAFGAGIYFRDPIMRRMPAGVTLAPATSQNAQRLADNKQLWTCSMHPQVIQDHPGICPICHMTLTPLTAGAHMATHANNSSEGTVMIDPIIVQRMGVRVASVESRKLTRMIRVVGMLEEAEPLHRDVNLRVSGWIETLYANVDGMPIEEGKPLFDLYSPEINLAINELIAVRKQQDVSDDPSAKSMYEATQSKLARMGLTDSQIEAFAKLSAAPRTIPILSPMTGHITAKMVYAGSAVKAGDLVLRIADQSQMWADLQIFEEDLPFINIGQTVTMSSPSRPGESFSGEISFIHPHLDMMTRTAKVRIVLPNHHHELREGMYVSAEIAATIADNAIVVPREAVIDTGSRQIAFIWKPSGEFEPRQLTIGPSDENGSVQVLDGLQPGDKVVTSGQFLIDSESRTEEAVQKILKDRLAMPEKSDHP